MKRFFILLLLFFSLSLIACTDSNKTFVFDRDNPQPIRITFEGELTSIKIVGNDVNTILEKDRFSNYLDNGILLLDYVFFDNLQEGLYTVTVTADNIITFNVKLSGELYSFNYINKTDIFTLNEDKYYIVFTQDSCSSCEKMKKEMIDFNNFIKSYPENVLPSLYVVNCSNQTPSIGTNDILTGIDNYDDLINNAKITTPTLAVVEKGIITSYYVGYSNVTTFINIETNNISKKIILHNIDNPKIIKVKLDFIPKKYSIISADGKKSTYTINTDNYTQGSTGFFEGTMYFSIYYFDSKLPGKYTLSFYNDDTEYTLDLYITSIFNYISIYDLFGQSPSKYYVFFLRDGCSACNSVKPTLLNYSQTYQKYNNGANYPFYAVHEAQHSASIYDKNENFIGASSLDELKIGYFPRVILIENDVITNVYIGSSNIINYFSNLLK